MDSLSFDFADQVVLITGAGRGNGAVLAQGFAQVKATVLVADIDYETATHTAAAIREAGGSAHGYALDVTDEAACRNLAAEIAQRHGAIHVLINNAGVLFRARFEEPEALKHWKQTVDVNVTGVINVTHAFLAHLKETKGSILNIASICSYTPGDALSMYSTSKGAVLQLTRAMAAEFADHGIRVNGLAPGSFPTAMSAATLANPDKFQNYLNHTPMGRTGKADELVGPSVFLSSPLASYITGAVVPVDGGYLTR